MPCFTSYYSQASRCLTVYVHNSVAENVGKGKYTLMLMQNIKLTQCSRFECRCFCALYNPAPTILYFGPAGTILGVDTPYGPQFTQVQMVIACVALHHNALFLSQASLFLTVCVHNSVGENVGKWEYTVILMQKN